VNSVGGSLPVAYAYYSEFLPRVERGRYLSGLVMMWALGGVYVALLAWIILPRTGKMRNILNYARNF
jgi:MFS transporter, VNT family, synaptic vesicle glycoprotein 2